MWSGNPKDMFTTCSRNRYIYPHVKIKLEPQLLIKCDATVRIKQQLSLNRCRKPFETAKTGHMSWAARWWEMEYKKKEKEDAVLEMSSTILEKVESLVRMIDPSFEKQTTGGGREERRVFHAFLRIIGCSKLVQWFEVREFLIVYMFIDINHRIAAIMLIYSGESSKWLSIS